ncbi:MAG: hypothetical protein AAF658_07965 [Myxococcota bacterium]
MNEEWVAEVRVGLVEMGGEDALDLLNRLSTNELTDLPPGGLRDTLLTTNQGRLIDWLRVGHEESLWLVCSEGRAAKAASWLETYTIMEDSSAKVITESARLDRWVGKRAAEFATEQAPNGFSQKSWGIVMSSPRVFTGGVDLVRLDDRGPFPVDLDGVNSLSADQYEMKRIEAGLPSPNFEFSTEINPLELRLGPTAISFSKGCYIGQEVISRMDSYDKVARALMGWRASKNFSFDETSRIVVDGRPVGRPSSSVMTPDGQQGLAVLKRANAVPGKAVLRAGGDDFAIELVDCPFWQKSE